MRPRRRVGPGPACAALRWRVACAVAGAAACAAACAVAGAALAPAVAAGALTLHEAAEQALAHHPQVAAARARLESAEAQVGEARGAWWPWVRLSGSAVRYEEPMAVAPIHGFSFLAPPRFERDLVQGQATLTYPLFDGGARPARVRAAGARAGAAAAGLTTSEQVTLARTASAYLDALARREMLAAHDQRLEALEAELARVERLLANGKAAEVERLRVAAAVAGALADRAQVAARLEEAERELARWIGAAEGRVPAATLASVTLAAQADTARAARVARAVEQSPGVAEARRAALAAEAGAAVARAARWPELRLAGGYTLYAAGDELEGDEWSAGLQASWALFQGGALREAAAGAAATARAAQAQVLMAQLDARREVDRALCALTESEARIVALRAAVAGQAEVARIEQLALDAGSGTQVDYLQAQAALLAGRAGLVEAETRRIAATIELARATGELDLAWLARTLEVHR